MMFFKPMNSCKERDILFCSRHCDGPHNKVLEHTDILTAFILRTGEKKILFVPSQSLETGIQMCGLPKLIFL